MIALILHHALPVLAGAGVANAVSKPKTKIGRRTRPISPQGAESPDAALIALCREFAHLNQETDRLGEIYAHMISDSSAGREMDAKVDPMVDRIHALRDEISDIRARTTDGLLAKARVALRDLVPFEQWPQNNETWMAISVLEDLLRRAES